MTMVTDANDPEGEIIELDSMNNYTRKVVPPLKVDGKIIKSYSYNFFPIILNNDGSPWREGVLYIIEKANNDFSYNLSTYHSIVSDLTHFKNYIDDNGIDMYSFPKMKLLRPTYRYRNFLLLLVQNGELSSHTAKRRVSAMIKFYRYLTEENYFKPLNPLWNESDLYIKTCDSVGSAFHLKKVTTDLKIKSTTNHNPFSNEIIDEGRLRPLPKQEQLALIETINNLGNTEMLLIHLIALLTGARIQTVLTLKKSHFSKPIDTSDHGFTIATGQGTTIDTKKDKNLILIFPKLLYDKIRIYSLSERYLNRARKIKSDDFKDYLFLSNRGAPYYIDKESLKSSNTQPNERTMHNGEAVRQFISKMVIPIMRDKLSNDKYTFRYHDLRATFGMNLLESQMRLVEEKKQSLHEAREYVKARMGHATTEMTDRYLNYKNTSDMLMTHQEDYEEYINILLANINKEQL
ncbi:tyrosine-type recombinase/integrase [Raoultella terrigena]|uniref:tyrosine-type recombinase/integrase n=1 Tax=Klebsiella grimontii TaxID=2058152 RepID=UPI00130EC104|nr:site-specific integrase [Klebsiella grimontii]QLT87598.1 site-specific integrase [Klebsiella grimontii]QQQ20255.1 site-specific integrase [Klebsiella grimontii]